MREEYKKEIDRLIKELEEIHPDLFRYYNRNTFYNMLYEIEKEDLSKEEIKLELSKMLAKLKDGHTCISYYANAIFDLRVLDDKVYIIDDYKNKNTKYKYKYITHINGVDINDVVQKVREVIPHETYSWSNFVLERQLLSLELLKALHIADDNIVITLNDGSIVDYNAEMKKEYVKGITYFENKALSDDTYDIKYGSCGSNKEAEIKKLFNSAIEDLKQGNYKKIIVDLRGNTGGNSSYFNEFTKTLKESFDDIEYAVLVDRGVFSSGVFALTDMMNLGAKIVGEQIGTTMNHFGFIELVNSDELDLCISVSNSEWWFKDGKYKRFQKAKGEVSPKEARTREPVNLDKEIHETIDDYENNYDPYIDEALKILNYSKKI